MRCSWVLDPTGTSRRIVSISRCRTTFALHRTAVYSSGLCAGPEGVALVKQVAATCDVLVQSMRPGAAREVGLSAEDIAAVNPKGSPRIMLAGHCDQLALMIEHIDSDGFLYVQPMGGWDIPILLGQRLTIWTKSGPIPAVVSRKAPHMLTADERILRCPEVRSIDARR